jgi:hypothetical protein
MAKATPTEARAFIARMDKALLPLFNSSVVPIFGEQNGVAIQCGTGTLFRVADRSFMVTASHVADIRTIYDIQLYVCDARPGAEGIPLAGALHSERNLDVAVLELSPEIVHRLPNRKFLTVHHADRAGNRITKGWYCVHGYPNCWSKPIPEEQKTEVKGFTYGTVLYEGDASKFGEYNPEIHVLLTVPSDGNVDCHGASHDMPKSLEGISGCSIWQAYYEGLPNKEWTPDDAMVVAVQTGTFQRGTVVKGTRWFVVNEILHRKYPDLEKPLSLITPHKRLIQQ